jgi:hypothetical protein
VRSAENIEKLVKNLDLDIDTNVQKDQAVLSELLEAQKQSMKQQSALALPNIRRFIMKSPITKLASAATIIIGVFLVLYLNNGSDMTTVALGDVLQNVEQIKYYTFRHKVSSKTNAGTPEETSKETDRITYISTEYGLRHDVYENGQLTGILYVPSSGTDLTYVMPVTKQYSTGTMSEEYREENSQVSPSGLIKEFMSYEYRNLGRKEIDGVEAEGIEVNESGFYGFESTVGRLWINIETNLPVKMVIEGTRGATKSTIITYDYNWDAELDPSIFVTNIPANYEQVQ